MKITRKVKSETNKKDVANLLLKAYFNFLSKKLPDLDNGMYVKCCNSSSRVIELLRVSLWESNNSKYLLAYEDMKDFISPCSKDLKDAFDLTSIHLEYDITSIVQLCLDILISSRNYREGVDINE